MRVILFAATAASAFASAPLLAQSGDVPRAEYITIQDAEFRKMDADKNGQLSRAEVEAYQKMVAVARAQAANRALFQQLDANHDGIINPAEFARLNAAVPAVDGRTVINALDSNHDGQVSLVEHRAGKLAYFDKIDLDKDGIVTVAEMRAAGVVK